jgi:dTDP-glucose 4,6-dehydratase
MINILITGGCGFIGSHFINHIFKSNKYNIINFDAMYYCANENNVNVDVRDSPNYTLIKGNLCNREFLEYIIKQHQITHVVHFAAQSHVQNSFENSLQYTQDNILGTHTLLEVCRKYGKIERFVHCSTDEVYGESMLSIDEQHKTEHSILCPTNPYAATKAGAELLAQSYNHSFKMPIIITRGNNVYGPNQYPEKLIPRFIQLLQNNQKLTIHGKGETVRAFLHVYDTAKAFECILEKGEIGEIYNIGCDEGMEYSVMEIAKILIKEMKQTDDYEKWVEYVEDRPFNDKRYYISNSKLKQLGWNIEISLMEGLLNLMHPEHKIQQLHLKQFENINPNDYFGEWIHTDLSQSYANAEPFKHVIINNFLNTDYVEKIYEKYPTDFENWHKYYNPIEVKYANDDIEHMPEEIKNLFYLLSTKQLVAKFAEITGIENLEYDPYLHGAGLHSHPRYGRLHVHLDYEKHPITNKQRRLNIILYLSKNWNPEWNGASELWDVNVQNCVVKSTPIFNNAIVFQTNEISYHGVSDTIMCPEGTYRKSFAYYYVSPLEAQQDTNKFGADESGYRYKASFTKRPEHPEDERMEKLYKIRPYRRITKEDMDEIWEDWTPEVF